MACEHDFVTGGNLPPTHCRCRHCLSSFPVSMWCEQLEVRIKKLENLLGMIHRKVDHLQEYYTNIETSIQNRIGVAEKRMKDFEAKVTNAVTEEVPEISTGTIPFGGGFINIEAAKISAEQADKEHLEREKEMKEIEEQMRSVGITGLSTSMAIEHPQKPVVAKKKKAVRKRKKRKSK